MWDLPGPGIEPVSPAGVGRFLTTAPPGKSSAQHSLLAMYIFTHNNPDNSLNLSKKNVVKGKRGQKWTPEVCKPISGVILANSFIHIYIYIYIYIYMINDIWYIYIYDKYIPLNTYWVPSVCQTQRILTSLGEGEWSGKTKRQASSRQKEEHLQGGGDGEGWMERYALGELQIIKYAWAESAHRHLEGEEA